ncbi:SatD family protein [Acetobacterium sp.]|uniref:SatD family protein n=1 Tax=Acetobacterium sp. TaxID=1872094 RepID=UPI002F4071C2
MYCAIIGDLIKSQSINPTERKIVQEKLENVLEQINNNFKENIVSKFTITLGDEFQGLLSASSISIEIIELILKELYPHAIRFGIGISDIYTKINPEKAVGADGPAYYFAREGIEKGKKNKNKTSFSVNVKTDKIDQELINALCLSIDLLMSSWTEKQREVAWKMSEIDGQQNIISAELGLNPSTVTRHLRAAHYEDYRKLLNTLEKYLRIEYDFKIEGNRLNQATSYYNKGIYLMKQCDFKASLENLQKALNIRIKELDPDHPELVANYDNISRVYFKLENYEKSLELFRKSIKIKIKTFGEDHPNVAATYNDMGNIYSAQSKYDEALEFYERALSIFEKYPGMDQSGIGTTYYNLGEIYSLKKELNKGLEYYQKSLEIREKVSGDDHSDLEDIYIRMGNIFLEIGELDKALEFFKKTLPKRLKDSQAASIYNNMGTIFLRKGNLNEALEYLKKALLIKERQLGPDHPETAAIYQKIASIYQMKNNSEEAVKYLNKVTNSDALDRNKNYDD